MIIFNNSKEMTDSLNTQPPSANVGASYSKIINAEAYNNLMTNQHLYISTSDKYIFNFIQEVASSSPTVLEVVEVGCGPARVTKGMSKIKNINLKALDLDPDFISYANNILPDIKFFNQSIISFKNTVPVDIFYSQGFHHHLEKGALTESYLKNIYDQLNNGGYYIIGDEFIPNYKNEQDRELKIVIWYSHIIAHALKNNYDYLAQEEAKTLLDDINEGRSIKTIKNTQQIELVLKSVTEIDDAAKKDTSEAEKLARDFLFNLAGEAEKTEENDQTVVLSRGDYKICEEVFRNEIEKVGFKIINSKAFGPIDNIGAMVVYILQK